MKINGKNIFFLVLICFLVVFPVLQNRPYGVDNLYNQKRLLQILLLLSVGLLTLFSSGTRQGIINLVDLFPPAGKIMFLLVVVFGALSSVLSQSPDWAFLEYGTILLLGIASIVIASATFDNPDKVSDYLVIAVWCFIALYVARYFTFYFLYHTELAPFWLGIHNESSFHSFTNPRFLNQVQSWVMPFALAIGWYYWVYKKESTYRWIMPALIGVWVAFIIDTGGRGTSLGILVGFLIILFLYIKNKSDFLIYNLSIVAISYGINYLFLKDTVKLTGRSLERVSSSGRFDNWLELLPEIFSQPLLGYGPMHYASLTLDNSWGHPHNWFLQFSYEWGLVVSFVIAYVFFSSIYRFGNHIKTEVKNDKVATKTYWVKIGLLWSLIAAITHGLVSGIIVMPMSQMWLVLIVGVSLGIYFKEKKYSFIANIANAGKHRLVELLLILISIGAISGVVIWGIQNPIDRSKVNYKKYEKFDTKWEYPRYWGLGKF